MVEQKTGGVFLGRARVAKSSKTGGARHVFAQIKGLKNDLVFAPWGGTLANPFPGPAKLYAGDIFEIQYDDKAEHPKLFALKTYETDSANGTTLYIVRDGYHHIPFVGDKIGVAPDTVGGDMTTATVLAVAKDVIVTLAGDGAERAVWTLTLDKALTTSKGDVLVEADINDKMLIKNVNAFAPCDYDFVFEPSADPTDDDDFENAEYSLTPVAGITAYTHRMSVLPACVLALNKSKWNGIFSFNALNA